MPRDMSPDDYLDRAARQKERRETIVAEARAGKTATSISREHGIPYSTVYECIERARAKGVLPSKPKDTLPLARRMRRSGVMTFGTVGHIVDTLTDAQTAHLLRSAPSATSLAEAIGVYLALNLPES